MDADDEYVSERGRQSEADEDSEEEKVCPIEEPHPHQYFSIDMQEFIKNYNKVKAADLISGSKVVPWQIYFDERGIHDLPYAVVGQPEYFEALNKDFRYQLTVIGSFAQAMVSREVSHNAFEIKTNQPNVKVSWQITGIRNDAYAQQNRIQPEVDKEPANKGKYLNPGAFGKGTDQQIGSEVMYPTTNKNAVKANQKGTQNRK
ncbi:MAG: hypothetical protein EBZ77_13390 [Chitinophagia bacterium]|nr:hypothetical protein [Chitinophagia bacterium]